MLKSKIIRRKGNLKGPFLLCGDYRNLHNRIIGKNDFERTLQLIKENKNNYSKVIIGLSRYNFFRINEVIKFLFNFIDEKQSANKERILKIQFDIFPIKDILSNFFLYIERIKKLLRKGHNNIEVELIDKDLPLILEIIGFNAFLEPEFSREKDLARLLGVICEEAFIGPQTMVIDPYHRCNVKCVHCFVHNPLINHQEEFLERKLPIDKFREIVDDAAKLNVDEIILQGDGEPLMHSNFLDMIRYIREKGMKALFFTNACFLNEGLAKEFIDLGVSQIYCSLPAGSEQSYEKICINPQKGRWFNIIVENMKALIELKKKFKSFSPILTMTHVIHKLNFHEIIKMAEIDTYIGADTVRFYLIRLDGNNKHLQLSNGEIASIKRALPGAADILKKAGVEFIDNIKFQLSHYDNNTGAWSKDIFLKEGCPIGWFFCLIPALGDISMCCHLRTVGYLSEKRFKEIWLSDYYRQRRYQAKFISNYRNVEFLNKVKLYDEHCQHCDNHQNLLTAYEKFKNAGLYKFLK